MSGNAVRLQAINNVEAYIPPAISFVPGEGHEGHASSLAIQEELSKLLANTAKDVAAK